MNQWNRLSPVTLAGKKPVTELIVDFLMTKSLLLGFFRKDLASLNRRNT